MGVYFKDKGKEKAGECCYCYEGTLAYDSDTGHIYCLCCKYRVYIKDLPANKKIYKFPIFRQYYPKGHGPKAKVKVNTIQEACEEVTKWSKYVK